MRKGIKVAHGVSRLSLLPFRISGLGFPKSELGKHFLARREACLGAKFRNSPARAGKL